MQTILLAAVLGAVAAADTVVVCPTPFLSALDPLVRHRTAQGHNIVIVPTSHDVSAVHDRIRRVAQDGRVRTIVLVGDAPPITERFENGRSFVNGRSDDKPLDMREPRTVPTHYIPAKINVLWGSEPEIATDNPYADFDGDRLPDAAIGRLTADTPSELSVIIRKIIDYENCRNFGPWRRRLNFVAGVGGFGAMADKALEVGAKALITRGVPTPYATTMTYGSWRSPYCPDPKDFHGHLMDRLNEGCLYWVYIGHGHVQQLDRLQVPGGEHHIFDLHDVTKLACRNGLPIAFFMACYTGAFDASKDCLAEEMLRSPGAPVAVISGSRVTMPYGMAVLGTELLEQCFKHRRETLGEAVLEAKRRMVKPERDDSYREALDLVASAISPVKNELAAERMEHIHLFNLLGDPLLRLRHPHEVQLDVPEEAEAGRPLVISGRCDVAGRVIVELVVRRERLTFTPPVRRAYDPSSTALAGYNDVYRRANDPRWESVEEVVTDGIFRTVLDVPREARGACHVRVFVQGDDAFAIGAADITIRRPPRRSQETTAARSPVVGETTAPQKLQR